MIGILGLEPSRPTIISPVARAASAPSLIAMPTAAWLRAGVPLHPMKWELEPALTTASARTVVEVHSLPGQIHQSRRLLQRDLLE